MATRVIDDSKLNAIAVAIQTKDNGGQMTVDEMPDRIVALPSMPVEEKDINFYNYDGELLYSYTTAEVTNLTELPQAPTVQGLTFQEWNWTLADIKSWALAHSGQFLAVGANFITTDGHTRIYMTLRDENMASVEMPFIINLRRDQEVIIDWGDNSNPDTITASGTYSHLWNVSSYPADVVIDINNSGNIYLGSNVGIFNNNQYYSGCVTKIELGQNLTMPSATASFSLLTRLRNISIPSYFTTFGAYAFNSCININFLVIPIGATLGNATIFGGCANLSLISIPKTVGYSYESFNNCESLRYIQFFDGATVIEVRAFAYCYSLTLVDTFNNVTNIGTSAFQGCRSLSTIKITNGVTIIGDNAFNNCTSLYVIDLTAYTDPQSIPTLVNTNAFRGIPALAEFWFSSQEVLDAFAAATNWSTLASKFVNKGV